MRANGPAFVMKCAPFCSATMSLFLFSVPLRYRRRRRRPRFLIVVLLLLSERRGGSNSNSNSVSSPSDWSLQDDKYLNVFNTSVFWWCRGQRGIIGESLFNINKILTIYKLVKTVSVSTYFTNKVFWKICT